jgi:Ribbon-helix-helix protein, copG family
MATYLPAELAARVEARAQQEERSNSQVMKRIIRDALNGSGTGPENASG